MKVIVVFPFAMLDWAKLVKSHSIQPIGDERVRVERVISLVEHVGAFAQTTADSVNPPHANAPMVVDDVPETLL
jgi:hypothetical protein